MKFIPTIEKLPSIICLDGAAVIGGTLPLLLNQLPPPIDLSPSPEPGPELPPDEPINAPIVYPVIPAPNGPKGPG